MAIQPCPAKPELDDFLTGGLAPERLIEIATHLEGCAACRSSAEWLDHDATAPSPLETVGRAPNPTRSG